MSLLIKDLLASIDGVDTQIQEWLYSLGIHRFDQLAALSDVELEQLADELKVPKDLVAAWAQQAQELATTVLPRSEPEPVAASAPVAAEILLEPESDVPDFLQPSRKSSQAPTSEVTGAVEAAPGERQQVRMGQLVENIPRKMRVEVPVAIEARISDEDLATLDQGMLGQTTAHDLLVTDAVTVELLAPQGGFTIQSLSRQTQWINAKPLEAYGLSGLPSFGSWRWTVTPLERGKKPLVLNVSAVVQHSGVSAERAIDDQSIPVVVRINFKQSGKRAVSWLAIAVAGGIAAEFGPIALSWAQTFVR